MRTEFFNTIRVSHFPSLFLSFFFLNFIFLFTVLGEVDITIVFVIVTNAEIFFLFRLLSVLVIACAFCGLIFHLFAWWLWLTVAAGETNALHQKLWLSSTIIKKTRNHFFSAEIQEKYSMVFELEVWMDVYLLTLCRESISLILNSITFNVLLKSLCKSNFRRFSDFPWFCWKKVEKFSMTKFISQKSEKIKLQIREKKSKFFF